MQLNISARHVKLTNAIADYLQQKLKKVERHFDDIIWAQAILVVEKLRHIVEIVVHTPGNTFRTKAEAGDLYSAIDLAAQKLDIHLTRFKGKRRDQRSKRLSQAKALMAQEAMAWAPEPVKSASREEAIADIIETHQVKLKPLPISKAIKTLDMTRMSFLPFINPQTERVSVIYQLKNGYGLLETEA